MNIDDKSSTETHLEPLQQCNVISRIFFICISIVIGWVAGQLIALGFIILLQKLGLDDNLFRFLDTVTLFKYGL